MKFNDSIATSQSVKSHSAKFGKDPDETWQEFNDEHNLVTLFDYECDIQ